MAAFNRTKLELKYKLRKDNIAYYAPFNRTKLELK